MEELARLFLGPYARPKEKITLMGEIVEKSMEKRKELSDDEVREEVMDRFNRLGMKQRVNTVSRLEEEICSDGLESVVYLLYRLSLSLDDGELLKKQRVTGSSYSCSVPSTSRSVGVRGEGGGGKEEKETARSPDDGCVDTERENEHPLAAPCLPSGNLSQPFLELLKCTSRANPSQRECVEVSMQALGALFADMISGVPSYLFQIKDGDVSTVSPLVISNQSISQTRRALRPILIFVNDLLQAESSLLECIAESGSDLPSELCRVALLDLRRIRNDSSLLLSTRPPLSAARMREAIEERMKRGDQFIGIARLLMKLRGVGCAECLDGLVSILNDETMDEELCTPILELLRVGVRRTIEEAEYFMLTGAVSSLGLIVKKEGGRGSTVGESYQGGRIEGERWRSNYGIRVGYGRSIDKETADEIMAEGKHALMRLRDPTLVGEYTVWEWEEYYKERREERKRVVDGLGRGVTARQIRDVFRESIRWVRSLGDRSSFLSRQISLVANSLEIVWQVFLLGDRVSRVPHFDSSIMERFNDMREAIAGFKEAHLLGVGLSRKSARSTPLITLKVSGALSIVVSSSNISIYTDAHKLLSKLSQVYHQLSQAYLCMPQLSRRSDELERGLFKGLAEITQWVGKLCGYFCSQVHEVVWKETNKAVLTALPTFDDLFIVHRKALKDLAYRLFLRPSMAGLRNALHASLDASNEFARNVEGGIREKAAENYTDFIERAQMFTHSLTVEEDPYGLHQTLLSLIDPDEKFQELH